MRAELSLPKQWEDWASWAFGIWLCLSPWALAFDLDPVPTRNAVIVGCLVILAEVVTLSVFRPWEEWVNVALGAWLVVSPWALAIAAPAATVDFVVIGALVVALALYEMRTAKAES
ncbi:MAG TPA: SPW repeat protein [Xanthobacteraceae bacterium]|nr:SPW repeat protein [Xanthobacteraceae bacterium]